MILLLCCLRLGTHGLWWTMKAFCTIKTIRAHQAIIQLLLAHLLHRRKHRYIIVQFQKFRFYFSSFFLFFVFSSSSNLMENIYKNILQLKNWSNILINFSRTISYFTQNIPSHLAITCSKLTIETLEQGVKYVQS